MNKTIAVIGTGIMGSGIAKNFLKKSYKVIVWNRNANKLDDFKKLGAEIAETPKEAASKANIVFEVTANDESSRIVWTEDNGILAGANENSILITNATLSISWTNELISICKNSNKRFFDMAMTGGRIAAETGKLILLVGGDSNLLKEIEDDLSAISEKIIYFGKEGSGMKFKLILNMVQAIHLQALGEALNLAEKIGLDIKRTGDALAERPGGTTTNLAWRDFQNEPKPINFSVEWITKDLKYAKELTKDLNTPLLNDALSKYQKAMDSKLGDKDWTFVNKI